MLLWSKSPTSSTTVEMSWNSNETTDSLTQEIAVEINAFSFGFEHLREWSQSTEQVYSQGKLTRWK